MPDLRPRVPTQERRYHLDVQYLFPVSHAIVARVACHDGWHPNESATRRQAAQDDQQRAARWPGDPGSILCISSQRS